MDRRLICPPLSPFLAVNESQATEQYMVGGPYVLHRDDAVNLTSTWVNMTATFLSQYQPTVLSEMYTYSMAAAHHQLPHFTVFSYMVSDPSAILEGWNWVDALPIPYEDTLHGVYFENYTLPTFLHYCQRYRFGSLTISKYSRVFNRMKSLFLCNGPLFLKPKLNRKLMRKVRTSIHLKRNLFAIGVFWNAVDRALRHSKRKMCGLHAANLTRKIVFGDSL